MIGHVTINQLQAPEMLKVKAGFHHDLNAKDADELWGPTFPCKDGYWYFSNLIQSVVIKHMVAPEALPSARSFYWLARMQPLEKWTQGSCSMHWHLRPFKKNHNKIRYHHNGYNQFCHSLICNTLSATQSQSQYNL